MGLYIAGGALTIFAAIALLPMALAADAGEEALAAFDAEYYPKVDALRREHAEAADN